MDQQEQQDIAERMAHLNLQGLVHRPNAVMYHVTNIRANEDNRYEALQTHIVDDVTYDGLLVGLPVVCFTTTLYEDYRTHEIMKPTKSPYPREPVGIPEESYKRVEVPLNRFRGYDWWEMRPGRDQVHLLFTTRNGHWSVMLRNAIGPNRFNCLDKQDYEHLQCHGDGENAEWHLNVYKPGVRPFVNISVLDEVQLDDECDWDAVQHSDARTGDKRRFAQRDAHYRKERWILEKVLGQKAVPDNSPEANMQSEVLRAAATACTVKDGAEFRVPPGMDQQQLAEFFREIARLLKKAPADLLKSIYHILYAAK